MLLAKLVLAWRKYHGVSLRQAAFEIGIEPSALFRFESGKRTGLPNVLKIILWSLSNK